MSVHAPLPYVVRLRMARGDDSVPDIQEVRLLAYSLEEAICAAVFQSTGRPGALDVTGTVLVDSVEPDMDRYLAMMAGRLAAKEARHAE